MEDKKRLSDLEEDEELASLRLAALATLKTRNNKVVEPQTSNGNKILSISSIARAGDNSSDPGTHKSPLWRNKRGRNFSKPNQRNLIFITPVGADNVKSNRDNHIAPKLLLPQHKWCQQVNEDSSSPQTDRRTGPSRFNRHGSGSESSDSDYDESDSDNSYSNDTILQDERSLLSPAGEEKNEKVQNGADSEPRLNFQNLDSFSVDKTEATVDSCYLQNKSENVETSQNLTDSVLHQKKQLQDIKSNNIDSREEMPTQIHCKDDKSSPSFTDSSIVIMTVKTAEKETASSRANEAKSKHKPIKFDSAELGKPKKAHESKEKPSEQSQDSSHIFKDLRNHIDHDRKSDSSKHEISSLSKNDLRFELKRKKEDSAKLVPSDKRLKRETRRSPSIKRSRDRSWSREYNGNKDRKRNRRSWSRSLSPKYNRRQSSGRHFSRSRSNRSSSSTSSSSSSLSSRDSSPAVNRSVSSVVQPVHSKIVVKETTQNSLKSSITQNSHVSSSETTLFSLKKAKGIEIKLNPRPNFQISVPRNDQQNSESEIKKRGPVHMRLGSLPRKRIIQMPKAVEAAFVNTSSDDDIDVNNKCKKSNISIVSDMSNKNVPRYSEKESSLRSEVPKSNRGKLYR